jgi:carbon-monoxide dehydrogenase medium subunit
VKPAPFEYEAPATVEEALSLLKQHGEEAKFLAGGQSLIPLLALRLARPTALVDLSLLDELRFLHEGDTTVIGAMTTHREVEKNEYLFDRCPMIREAMALVGHVAIRNRGTVGGSCAHADPAAEWPVLALVLDAEFEVKGPGGTRMVPADELFLSYFTTSLEPEEMVTEVRLRLPIEGAGTTFMELSRRHGDFGIAGVAAVVTRENGSIKESRVGLMGAGGIPVRPTEAERILAGSEPTEDVLEAATEAVDRAIEPTGDIHGSEDFRRNAIKVLTKRAVRRSFERARRIE